MRYIIKVMASTLVQLVVRAVGWSKLRTSLTCLCGLVLVWILVLYLCDDCLSTSRDDPVFIKELYQGLHHTNTACDISYKAKSWTTSLVTSYRPHLSANCSSLWAGDLQEVARVKRALGAWHNSRSDEAFLEQLRNCTYVQDFLSDNFYISSLEKHFQ